jgi:hypothetical protein
MQCARVPWRRLVTRLTRRRHFLFLGRCVTRRQALEQSLNNRLGQRPNDDRLWHKLDALFGGTFRGRQPRQFGTFLTQMGLAVYPDFARIDDLFAVKP